MQTVISLAEEKDAKTIAKITVASHQSAYKNLIPAEILSSLKVDDGEQGWKDTIRNFPGNVLIAKANNGEIVGFSCAGPVVDKNKNSGFDGQVYGIHIKPGLNGRGIGGALLEASFESMIQRHLKSVIIWTFKDNALAKNFYLKNGGEFIKEQKTDYKGHSILEIALGWKI